MSEIKTTKPIALAADHGGYELKEAIKSHLAERGVQTVDYDAAWAALAALREEQGLPADPFAAFRASGYEAQIAALEARGATRVDVGQSEDVTWTVLADPEGNEFCVLSSRDR